MKMPNQLSDFEQDDTDSINLNKIKQIKGLTGLLSMKFHLDNWSFNPAKE